MVADAPASVPAAQNHHPQTPSSEEERASALAPTLAATHFSPAKQVRFLEALALWGSVRAACKAVPASPQTVYRHRRASRDFGLAWDAALVAARPHVEDVLADRALNGIEEVIYYHGEEIGRRRRYDSRLLLAHLARLDAAGCDERIDDVAGDFDAALERLARGARVDPHAGERDGYDDDDDDAFAAAEAGTWQDESLPFASRVLLYLDTLDDDAGSADEDEAEDEGDGPDPYDPDDDRRDAPGLEPIGLSEADIALLGRHKDRAALDAVVRGAGPRAWLAEGHAARLAGYRRAEADANALEQRSDSAENDPLEQPSDGADDPFQDRVTPVTPPSPSPAARPSGEPVRSETDGREPGAESQPGEEGRGRAARHGRAEAVRRTGPRVAVLAGGPFGDGRCTPFLGAPVDR